VDHPAGPRKELVMSDSALTDLAYRNQGGLEVTLLWDARTNEVSIDVVDLRGGSGFRLPVAGHRARYAFDHPYAYALRDTPATDTLVEPRTLQET
jgi:hypothetical protein